MLDAARRSDVLVAAEHDERLEPVLTGPIRVGEAELGRVLARQEWDHVRPRHVGPEVDHQVAEVVFFLQPDGAVGQEDKRPFPREPATAW